MEAYYGRGSLSERASLLPCHAPPRRARPSPADGAASGGVTGGGAASGGVTCGGGDSGGVTGGGLASGGLPDGGAASGGVTAGGLASGGVTSGGAARGGVTANAIVHGLHVTQQAIASICTGARRVICRLNVSAPWVKHLYVVSYRQPPCFT